MTIREFFESKEDLAIHCDTKEKTRALLKAFDNEGYRWFNGKKYTDRNYWDNFRDKTCYNNKGSYDDIVWYMNNGYTIIEFEDIENIKLKPDLSQYTIDDLLDEIKRRIKG